MVQCPHVLECVQCISRADLVVCNPKTDDLHSDSLQTIPNEPHSLRVSPTPLKPIGQTLLNTIPGIPQFSGTEREKDTLQFEQWYHAISDAVEILVKPWRDLPSPNLVLEMQLMPCAVYPQGLL